MSHHELKVATSRRAGYGSVEEAQNGAAALSTSLQDVPLIRSRPVRNTHAAPPETWRLLPVIFMQCGNGLAGVKADTGRCWEEVSGAEPARRSGPRHRAQDTSTPGEEQGRWLVGILHPPVRGLGWRKGSGPGSGGPTGVEGGKKKAERTRPRHRWMMVNVVVGRKNWRGGG